MSLVKVVAALLIAAGALGLIYGGFSFTKETHDVKLGPLELSVKDRALGGARPEIGDDELGSLDEE